MTRLDAPMDRRGAPLKRLDAPMDRRGTPVGCYVCIYVFNKHTCYTSIMLQNLNINKTKENQNE